MHAVLLAGSRAAVPSVLKCCRAWSRGLRPRCPSALPPRRPIDPKSNAARFAARWQFQAGPAAGADDGPAPPLSVLRRKRAVP
jgi:hypothetical protein